VRAPETGTKLEDKPAAALLKDLSVQLTTLVHEEMELAKAELAQKGKRIGLGAGIFGGAGAIGFLAAASFVAAAIAGIATVLPVWAAALIIGGALAAAGGTFALVGLNEMAEANPPIPQAAMRSTKEDVEWLKTQARSAKP
jgi:hypothetical protein